MRDHVGKNLLRSRERANLSQEELALRASLHRTEIGLLERGERLPRVDTLVKLAGALGVSPCVLLEGVTWEPGYARRGQFEVSVENRD
ncbi:MAG TPA: helix-turn-helix transcriptional regulator [Solirubrobacterales bacterium]|nr:helix-turn-helix transcriptional regulator [Solirubrobacterales bacterium]